MARVVDDQECILCLGVLIDEFCEVHNDLEIWRLMAVLVAVLVEILSVDFEMITVLILQDTRQAVNLDSISVSPLAYRVFALLPHQSADCQNSDPKKVEELRFCHISRALHDS